MTNIDKLQQKLNKLQKEADTLLIELKAINLSYNQPEDDYEYDRGFEDGVLAVANNQYCGRCFKIKPLVGTWGHIFGTEGACKDCMDEANHRLMQTRKEWKEIARSIKND